MGIAVQVRETSISARKTYVQEGIRLKIEYVEPFIEAACSVLGRISGGSAEAGPLNLLGTTFPTACTNIVIRISGTLQGEVVYSMTSQTAHKLTGKLVGAEVHGFGRLAGAGLIELGEKLVRHTGRLLAKRGMSCEISGPTVFQGLNVEFSVLSPALTMQISTAAGPVNVSVAVRNGKQS